MKNLVKKFKISEPDNFKKIENKFYKKNVKIKEYLETNQITKFYQENENLNVKPGRSEAIKRLNKLKNQKKYSEMRNCMNYETSYGSD